MNFIPQKLFEIRDRSLFISLSKIKIEKAIPSITVSLSIKNLFGLVPHPSRWRPFHSENHKHIPTVIKDLYNLYSNLFKQSLWIVEGIKTMIKNYCESNQEIIANQNLLFIGKNVVEVDSEAYRAIGINPKKVSYLI